MNWKCLLGCDIKWKVEVEEAQMVHKNFVGGIVISEQPFIQPYQQGFCVKCGKLFRRKVGWNK
jgi:hypothetical protein